MPMMRRRGPGVMGAAARTAVVAGTATAVSGRVAHRQQEKYAADQAPPAPPPGEYAAAAPEEQQPAYVAELEQLVRLRDQGIITPEEFEAKKRQILGI